MDVSAQLDQAKSKYKPINVDRLAPPSLDVGHLAIFDPNALDHSGKQDDSLELYLTRISRDSTQMLFNTLFSLPTVSTDDGIYIELPLPKTQLPREKPLPKERPQTRWEKFAKEKGIQKRKRSRMVYDEVTGEYRPRFGYGSSKNDKSNDWLIPVPDKADPFEDQFAKRTQEKKDRIDKNNKQRLRNTAEANAIEQGIDPRLARKQELEAKLRMTKKATASMGKFDQTIKGDIKLTGVKRQFSATVGDTETEREQSGQLANKVLKRKAIKDSEPGIKVQKAMGMMQRKEEQINRDRKRRFEGGGDQATGGRRKGGKKVKRT